MAQAETEQEPPKKLLVEKNMNKRSHRHGGKDRECHGTNGEGTYFQEGDHVRIKRTQEIGRVHPSLNSKVLSLVGLYRVSKVARVNSLVSLLDRESSSVASD